MKKPIKVRTKVEAVVILILLIAVSVPALTVKLGTDSTGQDWGIGGKNVISNSNGNVWNATRDNLQEAIWDLNNKSGKVWVGSDITIASGITMGENITVDLTGHTLTSTNSFDVITMKKSSQFINGIINVSSIVFSNSCIVFNGDEKFNSTQGKTTMVDNVFLKSDNRQGTGILFNCDSTTAEEYICFVVCNNIRTMRFNYSIKLSCTGGSGSYNNYINSNSFSNIVGHGDECFIFMERNQSLTHGQSGVEGNRFENIVCQSEAGTDRGLYCEGDQNTFLNFKVWDFVGTRMYELNNADRNYGVLGGSSTDMLSEGYSNIMMFKDEGNITVDSGTILGNTVSITKRENNIRTSKGLMFPATGTDGVGVANIQRAIWSLNGTGGTVYLPTATISYSNTLKIPISVDLIGAGIRNTILDYTGSSSAISIDTGGNIYNIRIAYLTLQSDGGNSHGFFARRMQGLILDNVKIYNHGSNGIYIYNSVNVVVRDCFIDSCSNDGIYFRNVDGGSIVQTDVGATTSNDIHIDSDCSYIRVRDCEANSLKNLGTNTAYSFNYNTTTGAYDLTLPTSVVNNPVSGSCYWDEANSNLMIYNATSASWMSTGLT